jgi:hypothetical protein
MTVTLASEPVVTPGWFILEAVGSSLLTVKALFIFPHPSLPVSTVQSFSFLLVLFYCVFFTRKNTYKNP